MTCNMTNAHDAPVSTAANAANSDEIVEAMVAELKRGKLNDPRGLEGRQVPLFQYVREEVRRSLTRRGAPQPGCEYMFVLPLKDRKKFDVVTRELKKIARSIRVIKGLYPGFPGLPESLPESLPPTRVPDKELDADAPEAADMIDMFSKHRPTLTDGSPFRVLTELYYFARTKKAVKSTRNACERVLKWRKRFPHNTPAEILPPIPRNNPA
jgi:hypothetical protein